MSYIFDAEEVDAKDRAEFVREALASSLVPINIDWPDEHSAIVSRASITNVGAMTLCSGRSSASLCERTPTLARDATEPCIFINIQVEGTSMVAQASRQVVSRPGDLVLYDSTAPYTIAIDGGLTGNCLRIPHSALALPHNMIRQVCAVPLSPGHPIAAFTFDYLRRLATDPELVTDPGVGLLEHPSVELVRAVITTHLGAREPTETSLAATLRTRVLEYARANLHNPDLSGEQIAAAHHISVRYLYKVMAEVGTSLADWIRRHRLEAVRQDLARTNADVTIAAVARSRGFADMSSFSRSFRSEFGLTPRQWRDRHADRRSLQPLLTPGVIQPTTTP